MSKADDDLLTLARARWKQADEADNGQRKRELEDLSFYEGEGQWPADVRVSREGQPANAAGNLPPVPARPCITINKTREPVRHVLNAERQADLGIELVPADDFEGEGGQITHAEIELREGLIRRIQRQGDAQDARSWAFGRAVIAGRGFYGIMTRYLPGKTFDQEIYYRRFYNQALVKLDPAHENPDGSDAEWGFVDSYMRWDAYVAEFGRTPELGDPTDGEWLNLEEQFPGWYSRTEGPERIRMVRVSEYFYVQRDTRELVELVRGGPTAWAEDLKAQGVPIPPTATRREVDKKTVIFSKLDGVKVLDKRDWSSKYIPIIKIVGEEIQPFDNQRRAEGMIRPARDAGQGYNYMASALVESLGMMSRTQRMGAAGQFEGFETQWQQANVRNQPYLEYNIMTEQSRLAGAALGPPQLLQADVSMIQPTVMALQMFDAAVKTTTGIPDPTLGNVDPSIRSGRGLKFLLDQAQQGTSHYMDNLIRSLHYEARIVNDLLAPVYGRPGRLVRMIAGEGMGTTKSVRIGSPAPPPQAMQPPQPPPTGQLGMPPSPGMMPSQPGMPPPTAPMPVSQPQQPPSVYRLTPDADWNIAVKVSKQYDTRRQEMEAELAELILSNPEFMGVFGDLLFKYSDQPGSKELEQRAKVMLAPPVQAMLQAGQPVDPRLIQADALVKKLASDLQDEKQGTAAKIQQAMIKAQTDSQNHQVDAATRVQVAQIQATAQLAVADLKATADQIRQEGANQAEQMRAFVDALKEFRLQHDSQAHEKGLKQMEHVHALTEAHHGALIAPQPQNGDENASGTE